MRRRQLRQTAAGRRAVAGRASGVRPGLLGVVGAALLSCSAALDASAAVFVLAGGEQVEGRVLEVGERYLTVETSDGARLIARDAVARVLVLTPSGERVAGRLLAWRDGVFDIRAEDGRVSVRDVLAPGVAAGAGGPTLEDLQTATVADADAAEDPELALAQAGFPSAPIFDGFSPQDAGVAASIADGLGFGAPAAGAPAIGTETDDVAVRGMLSGLIFGDDPSATPPAVTVVDPDATDDAVFDRGFDTADAAFTRAAPDAAASADAAAEAAEAAAGEVRPATPVVAAPRFSDDPIIDAFASGALGRPTGRSAAECAVLAALDVAPPVPAALAAILGRADPDALIVRVFGDARETVAIDLADIHLGGASFRDEETGAAVRAVAEGPRPSRPTEVSIGRLDQAGDAIDVMLDIGAVDVALTVGARSERRIASGAARLVGVDPIAVVARPDAPLDALSSDALIGLLSGRITDWSMIDPVRAGAPTLYAPAEGSPSLAFVLESLELRRLGAERVRFVADPVERARRAAADPNALLLVSASTLAAMGLAGDAVAIDGARPDRETAASGGYRLTAPVFLELGAPTAHPAAEVFVAETAALAAAFDAAGLIPIDACRVDACGVGLEGAAATPSPAPLTVGLDAVDGVSSGAARAPALGDDVAAYLADVETLLLATDPAAGPAAVALRLAGDDPALIADGLVRAEALALAARCVGVDVRHVGLAPRSADGAAAVAADPSRPFILEIRRER